MFWFDCGLVQRVGVGCVLDSHITAFSGYHLVRDLSCYSEGDFRLKLGGLTVVLETSLSDVQISLQNKSIREHVSRIRLFIPSTMTMVIYIWLALFDLPFVEIWPVVVNV